MASNEVRIIGGKWRGRKLVFADRPGLRPTLGRVRETLFNWLRADVPGARCLDLYAGSGALGFEAASRGAAAVTLVESDRRAARCLRDNVTRLAAKDVHVVCQRAERFLAQQTVSWDVIFLDPPFLRSVLEETLALIADSTALAADGLVYVEASRHGALTLDGWRQIRHSTAGDTQFGLVARP